MKSVNPYNFVGLGQERSTGSLPKPEDELLTGALTCSLETLTPLIILGDCIEETNGHKRYNFFGYDGQTPIVPGSSIRGALRSVYEALTNSCMSTLTDTNLSTRVSKPRQPGLLYEREGKWFLRPAIRYMIKTGLYPRDPQEQLTKARDTGGLYLQQAGDTPKYRTGDTVCFNDGGRFKSSKGFLTDFYLAKDFSRGSREGVLLIGEQFMRKHHDHIFAVQNNAKEIPLSQSAINGLEGVLAMYRDEKVNNHLANKKAMHYGYDGYSLDIAKRSTGLPVWYLEVEGNYYLAPGCISRNVYYKKPTQFAREQGGYDPCKTRADLCEACALFGMVGEEALGGRLRFSDAEPVGDCKTGRPIVLPALMGPKLSTLEFYTHRPQEHDALWNYDYSIQYKDKKESYRILKPGDLKIRGRKFYWHHKPISAQVRKDKYNITAYPVNAGKTFEFTLYFNRVTKEELKRIIALIRLDGEDYAHKLGHGKPFGYGSVRMCVNEVKLRRISLDSMAAEVGYHFGPTDEYKEVKVSEVFKGSGNAEGLKDMLEMLKRVHHWDAPGGKMVDYPRDDNDNEIFTWFSKGRGSVGRPMACEPLPTIMEEAGYSNNISPSNEKQRRSVLKQEEPPKPADTDDPWARLQNSNMVKRQQQSPNKKARR